MATITILYKNPSVVNCIDKKKMLFCNSTIDSKMFKRCFLLGDCM